MVYFKQVVAAWLCFTVFGQGGQVQANAIHVENPDAGELLDTAQVVDPGVGEIQGAIGTDGDIDLYKLTLPTAEQIGIRLIKTGSWFDEDLFVFDSAGHPILATDCAVCEFTLASNVCYLGVSDWNTVATDSNGLYIADDFYDILIPEAVLGGWVATTRPYRQGPYRIVFSTPIIPEPATICLLGLGGLGLLRRRKNALV